MLAQAHVAHYYRGSSARIARRKFVRLQHGDDGFHACHCRNRLFAKERFGPDYTDDHARSAAADLCFKPELAHARDDALDLFFSGVRLRDDDHIPGSGIMRMPTPGIFCKPRYYLPKDS